MTVARRQINDIWIKTIKNISTFTSNFFAKKISGTPFGVDSIS